MSQSDEIEELHWMLGILQNIDVGLVVLDRRCEVKLWNGFMENHSGVSAAQIRGHGLFETCPELDEQWLRRKLDSVFMLKNRNFSTWQQRPYIFRFDSYRPITGESRWMYQNLTVFPLTSPSGEVEHVCLIVYDVTETAMDELALHRANEELAKLGRTDGLTGLFNRRAWEERLMDEYKRSHRTGERCVLAMFDIDHFKRVNDTYGHQAGDEVIREVAAKLNKVKRETDVAGRYGGEEFGVVLIDTGEEGALHFAERLRSEIEQTCVTHEGREIRFTISIGLASLESALTSHRQWIERADQALYQSKSNGRNRSTVFRKPPQLNAL